MKFRLAAMALMTAVSALAATVAHAQETAPPQAITVSGNAALVSDYRFRGVSQSNGGAAVQGGIIVSHESGAYAGFWSSNLAGWSTFGGPNLELDLVAGYKLPVAGGAALDVGLTWLHLSGRRQQNRLCRTLRQALGHGRPCQPDRRRRLCAQAAGAGQVVRHGCLGTDRHAQQSRREDGQLLHLDRCSSRHSVHPGHAQGPRRLLEGQLRPWPQRHQRCAHR